MALPAIALLLFAFAEPHYRIAETILTANNNKIQEIERKNVVKVEGLVLDENNKPLPGTSVVIKGTTIGTVCDLDGMFKLEIPENATIVMSFVGKRTIRDTYSEIVSVDEEKGIFHRKYKMEDAVIIIHNRAFILI